MADFAQLNSKNIVTQVIVVDDDTLTDSNDIVSEYVGISFCQQLVGDFSTVWKQSSKTDTFHNTTPMRGNYAGIGMTYMTNVQTLGVASTDIFIKVQPHDSWTVGVNTASWFAPIAIYPPLAINLWHYGDLFAEVQYRKNLLSVQKPNRLNHLQCKQRFYPSQKNVH